MDTMIIAALTTGSPSALAEAVASLPFDRVEAYESDQGRILIGRVGCSVVSAQMATECGCGNPDHDANAFRITVTASADADMAEATIQRNVDLMLREAAMIAAVTGQSVLRPTTERNIAAPIG